MTALAMIENQQAIIVKSEQELDAVLKPLLADGWKVIPFRPKSYFFTTSEDRLNMFGTVTLERNGEKKIIRIKSGWRKLGNVLSQIQIYRNEILLIGALLLALVLAFLYIASHI
jgi:hypothetical protein